MTLLSEYEQRTAWKHKPIGGAFRTDEGLIRKVDTTGRFVPCLGSTVVFRPGQWCSQVVKVRQQALQYMLKDTDILADPLPVASIHMTLHDLISPEVCASDPAEAYERKIAGSIQRAAEIVEVIQRDYADRTITMVCDRVVNLASKSLVLLLRPQTEQEYEWLLDMHRRFDVVQPLSYPLTPHITLAYFKPRPDIVNEEALRKLREAVEFVQIKPDTAPSFVFSPKDLTVQRFLDMKTYRDIPTRICFCCDGGLNRSVMAANILTHLAKERRLPVVGEARAAYPDTQGWPVPNQAWKTLEDHGIQPDRSYSFARYLEDSEVSHFTAFVEISEGAMDRISRLGLPREEEFNVSRFFFGVRDPEYGETTYEQAFQDLYARASRYLDVFAAGYDGGN